MFGFLKKPAGEKKFDRKVLRKNNISILILDERWNSLFSNTQKTPEIIKCEETLKELLKGQARLTTELKDISNRKKACMDRILRLTTEAFENGSEEAKKQMQLYQKEIVQINERIEQVQKELDNIPDSIKETNLQLLEYTVNLVYFKIRADRSRVEQLERMIEETREKLKEYIDEKETLSQNGTDLYSYFHDLLGGEELEKLDREYFKN